MKISVLGPLLGFEGPLSEQLAPLLPAHSADLASVDACDVAVYGQILWAHPSVEASLLELSRRYASLQRPVVVVLVDDFDGLYPKTPNLRLLRTSLRRSKKRRNEAAFPFLWGAFPEAFETTDPGPLPSVGFCGMVSKHRVRLVSVLESSPLVQTQFIKRTTFLAGEVRDRDVVQDFRENLRMNAFNVCNRGAGNFSIRFYQALSAGRIPVLVDTDLELPLRKLIPWHECCVIEPTEERCLSAVVNLHRSGQIPTMQRRARELYDQFLTGSTFLEYVFEFLLRTGRMP